MKIKKTLVAVTSAAALSVAMASAVTAGPPKVHGYLICTWNGIAEYPVGSEQDWTKRSIAAHKRDYPVMDGCQGGTIEVVETLA